MKHQIEVKVVVEPTEELIHLIDFLTGEQVQAPPPTYESLPDPVVPDSPARGSISRVRDAISRASGGHSGDAGEVAGESPTGSYSERPEPRLPDPSREDKTEPHDCIELITFRNGQLVNDIVETLANWGVKSSHSGRTDTEAQVHVAREIISIVRSFLK